MMWRTQVRGLLNCPASSSITLLRTASAASDLTMADPAPAWPPPPNLRMISPISIS